VNELVFYEGSSYISIKEPNTGNTPSTATTFWSIVAKEGATGKEGKEGKTGPTDNTGVIGVTGVEGKEGKEGKTGITGVTGATGAEGKEGKTGPTGPTGPTYEQKTNIKVIYEEGTNKKATANCPEGYVAIGGGGQNNGGTAQTHYDISGPVNSVDKTPPTGKGTYSAPPTAWFYENNGDSGSTNVTAYVICSK